MAATKRINGQHAKAAAEFDREPPWDKQAEMGVLSCVLLLPSVIEDVSLLVQPGDFFDPSNDLVYRAMLNIRADGKPVDLTMVISRLRSTGELDSVGGAAYITDLYDYQPNAAHAIYYAEIVAEMAARRRLLVAFTELLAEAYRGTDAQTLVTEAHAALGKVSQGLAQSTAITTLGEAADRLVSNLERPDLQSRINRAAYGVPTADEFIGPMLGGDITILAARPKMGKTFFAQQVARHSALQDRPVLLVNLEMGEDGLATREVCRLTDVDSRAVRRGGLNQTQVQSLRGAANDLRDLPFYLWTPPKANMTQIRSVVMQAVSKRGVKLVVLDYLTLIDGTNAKLERRDQLVEISRQLKQLAREAAVPFLVLAQLNRATDGTPGKAAPEPRLSNLAECGAFERDADTILFLHRDSKNISEVKLIGAALRNSTPGAMALKWDSRRTEFCDVSASDHDNYEPAFEEYNNR